MENAALHVHQTQVNHRMATNLGVCLVHMDT